MSVLRLPVCLALLVLVLHLLPPPAEACFTSQTSGRKKREAATGLLGISQLESPPGAISAIIHSAQCHSAHENWSQNDITRASMSLHEHMKGLLVSRSAVEQEEEIAFAACDTDQAEGLTWQEVEQCEV